MRGWADGTPHGEPGYRAGRAWAISQDRGATRWAADCHADYGLRWEPRITDYVRSLGLRIILSAGGIPNRGWAFLLLLLSGFFVLDERDFWTKAWLKHGRNRAQSGQRSAHPIEHDTAHL